MTGSEYTFGVIQIVFIVFITIFCRFLALQIREEKRGRAEAEALAKAHEATEKREREFMTMTSHQLMTPLSIIRGFSSLLYKDEKKKLTAKQQDYSKEIYFNSIRIIDLVSELMSVTKIRSVESGLKLELLPLEDVIENVIKELKPSFDEKKISLIYHKPKEKIPQLKINSKSLEQALYNMVENAFKYTDKGQIEIAIKILSSEVIVSVSDTGRGIAEEEKEQVFNPFFRGATGFEKHGTGLGLYIVKLIIEKHSGKTWFKSEINKGSTFSFSLPIIK